ncbi:uncharacterized protein LOC134190152 [Corticium candelabrum]|uniref:uncharacterized protein LOC134190152 n=1 Tax=Corticium candelabrum TaxID=121492 RepID=UPI002E252ED6|nr:uncharacterized protein LOC134190152 [Corticium candelabrum]
MATTVVTEPQHQQALFPEQHSTGALSSTQVIIIVFGLLGGLFVVGIIVWLIWKRYKKYANYDPRPLLQFSSSIFDPSRSPPTENLSGKWWKRHSSIGYVMQIQYGIRRMWIPTLETIDEDHDEEAVMSSHSRQPLQSAELIEACAHSPCTPRQQNEVTDRYGSFIPL